MKIVITGSSGQLGNALSNLIINNNSPLGSIPGEFISSTVVAVDVDQLDITNKDQVFRFVEQERPDIIINCAAFTNVNACETNAETAFSVNAEGPKNLALASNMYDCKIVHISTDYVFNGNGTTPYIETDLCSPNSVYGSSKLLGEKNIVENCNNYFIVRTSWLYGLIGNNFVKTMIKIAKEKGSVTVVDDQRGNPTNAEDLAYHILLIASGKNYGIYHCTGQGECSWYEFACKIFEYSNILCNISPCTTEEFPTPAKRPAYSSLRNLALENTVGDKMRDWKIALQDYIKKLQLSEEIK